MTTQSHHMRAAIASLLASSLVACTPIPIYKPPTDTTHGAHIKLSLKRQGLVFPVARISRTEGDIICGEPLPNQQIMFIISRGNPLIADVNPSGVYIPAGQKFTFSAMGLVGASGGCGRIMSFVPKTGSHYEINMGNTYNGPYDNSPQRCPIELLEVDLGGASNMTSTAPVETTDEHCTARK